MPQPRQTLNFVTAKNQHSHDVANSPSRQEMYCVISSDLEIYSGAMQDKEINRRFEEVQRRLERVEDAKPGEPVLGSELDKTLRKIDETTSGIRVDFGKLGERVDNHMK